METECNADIEENKHWISDCGSIVLHNGDAKSCLSSFYEFGADALITDPIYGLDHRSMRSGANKKRAKSAYTSDGLFSDTPEEVESFVVPVIADLIANVDMAVVTPGNKCFTMYPPPDSFGCLYQPASPSFQSFGYADCQPIFYYGTPANGNAGKRCSFVVKHNAEGRQISWHPCPKPISVVSWMVTEHCKEDAVICDPYLGSGTTAVAAVRHGKRFIGAEIVPEYFQKLVARVRDEIGRFNWLSGQSAIKQKEGNDGN